jgi:hypothetical protein
VLPPHCEQNRSESRKLHVNSNGFSRKQGFTTKVARTYARSRETVSTTALRFAHNFTKSAMSQRKQRHYGAYHEKKTTVTIQDSVPEHMTDTDHELLDLRVALAAEKVKTASLTQEVARLRETVGKLVQISVDVLPWPARQVQVAFRCDVRCLAPKQRKNS